MCKFRWLLALPLALAASVGTAGASTIRDHAGMFSPDVVRQAEAKLNQIESDAGLTTTIETIDSLKGEPIADVTRRHAQRSNTEGIYILIPKEDKKLWVLVSRPFRPALTEARQEAIFHSFAPGFKQGDFDAGLKAGVDTIAREVSEAKAANGGVLKTAAPAAGRRVAVPAGRGIPQRRPTFGLSSLLMIGLLILAVLFVIRLLGSLFGGGYRGGYAGPGAGRMGGPGYGPGYGGGGGGGFFSNMLGGLGGALAGNWLYDQFSGRHHGGYTDSSAYGTGGDVGQDVSGGDTGGDWSGGGVGGDWGGGGGDVGGGGDWGGGGGDWGGGGDGGGGGDW
jgi:uncharacterized protein